MNKRVLLPLIFLLLSSCGAGGTSSSSSSSEPSGEQSSSERSSSSESSSSSDRSSSSEGNQSHDSSQDTSEESQTNPSSSSESSSEAKKLDDIDYVKVYSPRDYNYIYCWISEGSSTKELFGGWPGTKMNVYDDNWATYDIKNNTSFKIIFHDNNGNQSTDLSINGVGHYFYMDGIVSKRDTLPSDKGKEESSSHIDYDLPDNKNAYKNFYQLLVYSFADSNGDGIGDFKGIKNKLPYLQGLGIESIWLSPINTCQSYHAYDVIDYYEVNKSYEVNGYTLEDLIEDAHKMGMEIVLDLVLNHTSSQHKWLKEHPSWYGSDDKFGMPEFNFDNKEVRAEMKKIGKYWLEKGVDGFRLDAAMWVYNSGSQRHQKNYEWWNEWCGAMREYKDDVYIIAEVLDKDHDLAYSYAEAGFNSTFDFEAMKHVYNAVTNSSYDYAGNTIKDMNKAYKINPNYVLGRPLSNHDIGRFSDKHNDMGDAKAYYLSSNDDLRLANSINILTPGNTFIYYGDELGLKGTCPQGWDDMKARTPMPFGTGTTVSTKYFNGFKGDGKTTSTTLSGKTAEEEMNSTDINSLYLNCSKLLNLKKENPTLKNGTLNKMDKELPAGLNGYTINGEKNFAVVYNSSSSTVNYTVEGTIYYTSTFNNSSKTVSIPSKGLVLYSY